MSVIRVSRISSCVPLSHIKLSRNYARGQQTNHKALYPAEYNDVAVYPEILDTSAEARKRREFDESVNRLRDIETVEEKIFKLNMPKYYGWKCYMIYDKHTPLYYLPFAQHITRTHLIKSPTLPDYYMAFDTAASYAAKHIQSQIEDTIKYEYQDVRRRIDCSKDVKTPPNVQEEEIKSKIIIERINRTITNYLAPKMPHLLDAQLDIEPRHESFWFAGGFPGGKYTLEKMRKGKECEIVDIPVQYLGSPTVTLRSPDPLEPLLPYSEASNESLHVPEFKFGPETVKIFREYRHVTNIPGFWPGDSHEFGILSFYPRSSSVVNIPESYPLEFIDKSLDAQGIINSFSWLLAQACYQGFSTYNDLTYPLVTQTVITNGQYWSLFAYQVNTLLTYRDNYKTNKLRNICYSMGPLKLFDGIDNDGKLVGFNEDVLKMLIQFYVNAPCERVGVELKPYLGKNVKHIADYNDDKKRNWLEEHYKYLISNRGRHRLMDEVYHWEWIYKIMFQSKWGDANRTRRFFEYPNVTSPWKRRLDEHTPKYIPKVLRETGYKRHVMWEKTYYP